jgi:hypothetical protein
LSVSGYLVMICIAVLVTQNSCPYQAKLISCPRLLLIIKMNIFRNVMFFRKNQTIPNCGNHTIRSVIYWHRFYLHAGFNKNWLFDLTLTYKLANTIFQAPKRSESVSKHEQSRQVINIVYQLPCITNPFISFWILLLLSRWRY